MAINLELSNCCPSSAQLVAMSGPSSSMSPTVDSSAASTWVFPQSTAYAVRDYQVNICKQALVLNTLVCLPTGLGKTLIAAVVMYNYYRWFPHGKIAKYRKVVFILRWFNHRFIGVHRKSDILSANQAAGKPADSCLLQHYYWRTGRGYRTFGRKCCC